MSTADISNVKIVNPGFEDPVLPDGGFTLEPPTGWTAYNPNGLFPENAIVDPTVDITEITSNIDAFSPTESYFPNGIPEGRNVGNVSLVQPPGSGVAGLAQTLDDVLAADTKYTLTVDVGSAAGSFLNFDLTGSPGYRVELLAGDTVLAADQNNVFIPDGTFGTSTVTYTATSNNLYLGQNLGVRLINILQNPGVEVDFDNVRLTAQPIGTCDSGNFLG